MHTCRAFSQCEYDDGEPDSMTTIRLVIRIVARLANPYIRELFPTSDMVAAVGFLASMSTDMNSKSAFLDKSLVTTRSHAGVRSLVRMDPIMSLEVRVSVEALEDPISHTLCHSPLFSGFIHTLLHVCQSH